MNYRLNLGEDLGEYGDVLCRAKMGFKTATSLDQPGPIA